MNGWLYKCKMTTKKALGFPRSLPAETAQDQIFGVVKSECLTASACINALDNCL